MLAQHIRIQEAAKFLGVSTKTLRRWSKSGKLIPQRSRGGHRFYTYEQLRSFTSANSKPEIQNLKQSEHKSEYQSSKFKIGFKNFNLKNLNLFRISIFGFSILLVALLLYRSNFSHKYLPTTPEESPVLGAATSSYIFNVNAPSIFNGTTTFSEVVTFDDDITAPNIIYSVKEGTGIDISSGKNPVISNTGVLSVNGSTGALTLSGSSGISVSGLTITNSDTGSSQNIFKNIAVDGQTTIAAGSNNGTLTFAQGEGILLTTDNTTKTLTITGNDTSLNVSGWQDNGTTVSNQTLTDLIGIGTADPEYNLDVAGTVNATGAVTFGSLSVAGATTETQNLSTVNNTIIGNSTSDTVLFNGRLTTGTGLYPLTDLGASLGTADLRFENVYVANFNSNTGLNSQGQATFTYSPSTTNFANAVIALNPEAPPAGSWLLGLGVNDYQHAGIDTNGNVALGYSDLATIPTLSNPLTVFGHNGTSVASVDTTGKITLSGNLDINGAASDIAGTLNLSGNALTSSGTLNITPAAGNNLNVALSSGGEFTVNSSLFALNSSTGFIGIGTTNPAATFDFNLAANADGLALSNSGNKKLALAYASNTATLGINASDGTNQFTNGTFETDVTTGWNATQSYLLNDQFTTDVPVTTLVSGGLSAPVPTTGDEMLANPGFEEPYSNGLANGWLLFGTATLSEENTIVHGGVSSQKINATNANGIRQTPTFTIAKWYQASGWFYSTTEPDSYFQVYDGATVWGGRNPNFSLSTWNQRVLSFRSGGNTLGYMRSLVGLPAGAIIYTDDNSLKPLSLSSLFSTTTEATANKTISAGVTLTSGTQAGLVINLDSATTPNNFLIAYHDGTNMHLEKAVSERVGNTGFETVSAGPDWASWTEVTTNGSLSDETSIVHSGSHAAKLTKTGSSGVNPYISINNFVTTPGVTYNYSFWTRGDGTNAGRYAIYDQTHGSYLVATGSTGVSGTTYQQVTGTFTAPAGTVAVTLMLIATDTQNGNTYFDDASITPTTSDPVYTSLINTPTGATYVAGAPIKVSRIGNVYQLFYNGAKIGTDQTINDAGIVNNSLQGLFSTYASNSFTNFLITSNYNGTQAEPTGGSRYTVDGANKITNSSGLLSMQSGTNGYGNPGIWYGPQTRTAGRTAIFQVNAGAGGDPVWGWDINTNGDTDGHAIYRSNIWDNGKGVGISDINLYSNTKSAVVLRSTGAYYFIKDGGYPNWTLIWVSKLGSATPLYPAYYNDGSGLTTSDYIKVPSLIFLPTPLAYDTFTRGDGAIGSTEASSPDGVADYNAPALAWTGGTISGSKMVITPTLGNEIVANGQFSFDTDWTKGSGWTIANGVANATTASGNITQNVTVTPGNWYSETFTVSSITSGKFRTAISLGVQRGTTGTYTETDRAGSNPLSIGVLSNSSPTGSVDDVSVKPLTLSSLFASVPASTPDIFAYADVTVTQGTQAGFVTNLDSTSNPLNFRIVYTDGTSIKVDQVVNGVYTNKLSVLHSSSANLNYADGRTLGVMTEGTKMRVFYNGYWVGTLSGSNALSANTNTRHGLFSTYSGNSFDNFVMYPRGTSNEYNSIPADDLTITRDTSKTYSTSAGSAKLVATTDGIYTQSLTLDSANYTLTAYAYTDGSAVTSNDVVLYSNGTNLTTTYTPTTNSGWYKLQATVAGPLTAAPVGVKVKAGKTVYVDNVSLNATSGINNSTLYVLGSGPNMAGLDVQTTTTVHGGLNVLGAASQTANLSEWQDGSGNILSAVTSTGRLGIGTTNMEGAMLKVQGEAVLGATTGNILTASASGTTKLNIDTSGNIIQVAGAVWKPISDSSTALGIANAAGTSLVSFDTTNSNVTFNSASMKDALSLSSGGNKLLAMKTDGASSIYLDAVSSGTNKLSNNGFEADLTGWSGAQRYSLDDEFSDTLPATVASDAFGRTNGALGSADVGGAWTGSTFVISGNKAANVPNLGTDVVTNGNMETGNPPTGWTANGQTVAGVADQRTGGTGTQSISVTKVDTNWVYQAPTIAAGTWLNVSAWIKNVSATYGAVQVWQTTGTGTIFPQSSSASWTNAFVTGRLNAANSQFQFYISGGAGQEVRYDDIVIKPLTLSELFSSVSEAASSDLTVQADVAVTNYTQAGIVMNLDSTSNPQNFVIAYIDGAKAYLEKNVGGTYTTLIYQGNITYSAGATLKVIKNGTSYSLFYNGAQVGTTQTISDAGIINNTKHGLFSTYSGNTLDNFSVTSGVNGTLATDGVNTRTVTDTLGKASNTNGVFGFTSGEVANEGLWESSTTRVAGKYVIGHLNLSAGGNVGIGFDINQSGQLGSSNLIFAGGSTFYLDSNGGVSSGTFALNNDYYAAVILKGTGAYYFIKGGAYSNWTLLNVYGSGTTSTLYPAINAMANSSAFTSNYLIMPSAIYIPTPLAYDTFTRADGALGTSELTGPDAQTTPGLSWTGSTWTISTNKVINTPNLGDDLITNGNMETNDPPDNWVGRVSAVLDGVADERTGGGGSQALDITIGGNNYTGYQTLTSVMGTWYQLSGWTKNIDGTGSLMLAGNGIITSGDTSTSWVNQIATGRATSTDGTVYLVQNGATGKHGRFDDVVLKPLTTSELFSSVSTSDTDVIADVGVTLNPLRTQAGLVLNLDSTSSPANFLIAYHDGTNAHLDKAVTNLIDARGGNAGFETLGSGGNDVFALWTEAADPGCSVQADATNGHTGTYSAKLNRGVTGGASVKVPVTAGITYNYSFWAKTTAGQTNTLYVYGFGSTQNKTITDTWQEFTGTFTVSSGYFILENSSGSNNSIYVDDVTLTSTTPVYSSLVNNAATYSAAAPIRVITYHSDANTLKARLFYNNASIGVEVTITDAGIITNTKHGLFSTYSGNSLDNFSLFARGSDNEYAQLTPADLTVTRDTGTTYNNSASSAKLIAGATDNDFTQSVNVGDTGTYTLTAYAYTDGSAVTGSDLQLYYNSAPITTVYSPALTTGWYKLQGNITGVALAVPAGVRVKAGKTVYVDNFYLDSGAGGTNSTFYLTNSGTGLSGLDVQSTTTLHSGNIANNALTITGVNGQSANLTEWQNATGAVLTSISPTGIVNATVGGIATMVKAGIPTDADFTNPVDGLIVIDSTDERIYFRYGGAWHYREKNGGFQIPADEAQGLTKGDLLMPFVDGFMSDGAVHGLYTKLSDVKSLLMAPLTARINTLSEKLGMTNGTPLSTLSVLGTSTFNEASISGELNVGTISIKDNSVNALGKLFLSPASFNGSVRFDTDVAIDNGVLVGNDNIRGQVALPADASSVFVSQNWNTAPKSVVVTPSFDTDFYVANITKDGFEIKTLSSSDKDQVINWIAVW